MKWGDFVTLEYGKSLKGYREGKGDVPVFGTNGPIGYTDKPLCNVPSVIIGRKGAYRGVHYSDKPFFVIDTAFYLKPKDTNLDLKYCYYYLKTLDINSMDSGSAIPSTSREDFYELPANIPDLPTQTAIAEILSSLDDKIELNNQINQNLEALGQALFKRWFVDFEFPDENGQPYKSSGGIMVESALGEIPKGWNVIEISDLIEVRDGTHDSPKPSPEGFYLITSKHLKNNFIDFESCYKISEKDYTEINKRSQVDQYDILITMIGTVGNLYFVGEKPDYAIKNIGLFKSSQKKNFGFFLYQYLKSPMITRFYTERLAGSTQQYLTLKVLRQTPVLYDGHILEQFVEIIKPLTVAIFQNSYENVTLKSLRDLLLAKLISGELEVQEAKEVIQEA